MDDGDRLPTLPLAEWEATKDTLHLWAQIIGKTRLALMPMRNHWWNVTLYPSARGLTTHRMPLDANNLEIELDLTDHQLRARTTESDAGFEPMRHYFPLLLMFDVVGVTVAAIIFLRTRIGPKKPSKNKN